MLPSGYRMNVLNLSKLFVFVVQRDEQYNNDTDDDKNNDPFHERSPAN